jgi:hypothetical protein
MSNEMNETKRQNAFELICKPASNKMVGCRILGCGCGPWMENPEFCFAVFQIAKGKHPEDYDWIDPWNTPIPVIREVMLPLDDEELRRQDKDCLLGGRSYAKYLRGGTLDKATDKATWSADMVLALYDVFLDASPNKILSGAGDIYFLGRDFSGGLPQDSWPFYCIEMAIVYMRRVISSRKTLKDIYHSPNPGDISSDFDDWEIFQQIKNLEARPKDISDRYSWIVGQEILDKMLESSPHGEYDAEELLRNGWYAAKFILEKELEINSAWSNDLFNFSNAISNEGCESPAQESYPDCTLQLISESIASSVPIGLNDMQKILDIRTSI